MASAMSNMNLGSDNANLAQTSSTSSALSNTASTGSSSAFNTGSSAFIPKKKIVKTEESFPTLGAATEAPKKKTAVV